MSIVGRIKDFILGPYKVALKRGLEVGKDVTIIGRVDFGSEPYLIKLGDYVKISYDVAFITHDGGTWAFRDFERYKKVIKYGKITVGERSFIGCRSIILPGVNIGKRCVIGAGSIVTTDIPDGSVVCGVPARVIMSTEEYAEKCLKNLKEYNEEEYLNNKEEYLKKWL